ncbi:ribosomal RNA small subunit methyltransferase H-like [Uloborus diversus]|uniref:ribosomal RNA small subunit methyltransferase H-like n=1 Tax=Uloborus diversus TaxID=327109 RepID=UPI00240990E6|nr:ribosomal RNA small subunit methyltransferase H-like [Uloborus diversus]
MVTDMINDSLDRTGGSVSSSEVDKLMEEIQSEVNLDNKSAELGKRKDREIEARFNKLKKDPTPTVEGPIPTVDDLRETLKKLKEDEKKILQSTKPIELGSLKFDGIVMDLGVSSMQLDSGDRGFSFTHDGPLDMRMSSTGYSAVDFINKADEQEIADVIYKYGDESYSRRIAKNIIEHRLLEPITNTAKFAHIVRSSIGFRKGKIDTATKTFQAIRIYINDELGQLERFLSNSKNILAQNGRLVIVSFHSLEDRIVKNFLKANSAKLVARSKYAAKIVAEENSKELLKILTKKPIMIDATIVRAHACSSGYIKGNQEEAALGRSRGGFSTKIHALVDALGNPFKFILTALRF